MSADARRAQQIAHLETLANEFRRHAAWLAPRDYVPTDDEVAEERRHHAEKADALDAAIAALREGDSPQEREEAIPNYPGTTVPAYGPGYSAAEVERQRNQPSETPGRGRMMSVEDTPAMRSICAMLGWANLPSLDALEKDIALLKRLAQNAKPETPGRTLKEIADEMQRHGEWSNSSDPVAKAHAQGWREAAAYLRRQVLAESAQETTR